MTDRSRCHMNRKLTEVIDFLTSTLFLHSAIFFVPLIMFSYYIIASVGVVDYEVYGHYFCARYLYEIPSLLVHWYSKPLFTALTSAFLQVFQFGVKSLQFFDSIISSVTCYVVYKLGLLVLNSRKYSILAVVMLLSNQLFFSYAYSGILEPFFALLLALAMYFYYTKDYSKSVFLISLNTLVRLEGFVLIPLWTFLILRKPFARKEIIRNIPLLYSGPILWMIFSLLITNDAFWPIRTYLRENNFGPALSFDLGLLLHYPVLCVTYLNAPFLVLFLIGLSISIWKRRNLFFIFHILFIASFSMSWFLFMFSYHPNIPALSMRLLVDVLPLSALVVSFAAAEIFVNVTSKMIQVKPHEFGRRLEALFLLSVTICSILVSFATSNSVVTMIPHEFNPRESMEKQVGQWLSGNFSFKPEEFYCSNPAIIYYWGVNYFDVLPISVLSKIPPENGSFIVWDSIYGIIQGMPYFLFRPKYRLVTTFESQEYLENRFEPVHPTRMTFVVNVFQYDEALVNDLEISPSYVLFNTTSPRVIDAVLISAMVRNVGNSTNGAFMVGFWADNISEENVIRFDTVQLDGSPTYWVWAIWRPSEPGTHQIYVVVDPNNLLPEYNKYNNYASVEIEVTP